MKRTMKWKLGARKKEPEFENNPKTRMFFGVTTSEKHWKMV